MVQNQAIQGLEDQAQECELYTISRMITPRVFEIRTQTSLYFEGCRMQWDTELDASYEKEFISRMTAKVQGKQQCVTLV